MLPYIKVFEINIDSNFSSVGKTDEKSDVSEDLKETCQKLLNDNKLLPLDI